LHCLAILRPYLCHSFSISRANWPWAIIRIIAYGLFVLRFSLFNKGIAQSTERSLLLQAEETSNAVVGFGAASRPEISTFLVFCAGFAGAEHQKRKNLGGSAALQTSRRNADRASSANKDQP
jgi:hypothetical protein